jgi:hypothetical protein
LQPGGLKRFAARIHRKASSRFAIARYMSATDPGALDDPFVRSVDLFG